MRTFKFFQERGLTPAEQTLLDDLDSSAATQIGTGDLPPEDAPAPEDDDTLIHADFLRYLLLGGCDDLPHRIHETGLQLSGARITGQLDLGDCTIPLSISLFECRFDTPPNFIGARLANLYLNGGALPGLNADGLVTTGVLFLRNTTVTNSLRLLGAEIGGNLEFTGATFTAGESGDALSADSLKAKYGVFLSGITSTGEIRLLGAEIGGDLSCTGATLTAGESGKALSADGLKANGGVFLDSLTSTGEVRLLGAEIGRNLECNGATITSGKGEYALNAENARVTGALFLRDAPKQRVEISGNISLQGTSVSTIADAPHCWPETGLLLDRFTYGAFLGDGDVADADRRIKWLSQQYTPHLEAEFRPQPWVQCAKVLAESGHRADARAVLIEKEKRQRRARRRHRMKSGWWRLARPFYAIRDDLFYTSVGYGHATSKAFVWLLTFWGLGVAVFGMAEHAGAMKPNNAFILRAPEWVRCGVEAGTPVTLADGKSNTGLRTPGQTQPACFLTQEEGKDYPRFNPYTYSLDTLVPLVSMEMQGFWVPDASSASLWGRASRWFLWVQIAVGWALSLLAVAGFSGLVRND